MKLVYIEWLDACSYVGSPQGGSWKTEEEALDWAKNAQWLVKQSGFILGENKEYLTIAGMYEPGSDIHMAMFGQLQKIPKTWIKKRVDLTKYTK